MNERIQHLEIPGALLIEAADSADCPLAATKNTVWPSQSVTGFAR
jgi:hypothetical protein